MKTEIAKTQIQEFCVLVNKGIEAWVDAGKLLVKIVEADPEAFEKIYAGNPHLTTEILLSFERMGRGEIYPYLLVDGSPGARKLVGLPYASQVKLYNGTVEVVSKNADGFLTRRVKVRDLNSVQASRVFDSNRIRSPSEQQKMLSLHRRRSLLPNASSNGSEEETIEPCDLADSPKAELTKILTRVHAGLLDARTALALVKLDSDRDVHITRALQEVGHLRLAVNEEDL